MELVGECWLQSARVARKAGHHQTAFNALLNAENTHLAELVTEKAKWLWSKVKPTCKRKCRKYIPACKSFVCLLCAVSLVFAFLLHSSKNSE